MKSSTGRIRNIIAIVVGIGLFYFLTMPFSHDFYNLKDILYSSPEVKTWRTFALALMLVSVPIILVSLLSAYFIPAKDSARRTLIIVAISDYLITFLSSLVTTIGNNTSHDLVHIAYLLGVFFFIWIVCDCIDGIRKDDD